MSIKDPTLRERIRADIAGQILSGALNTGSRLPSERELAAKFGVSRSIVHLAIEDLGRAGLVELRPRSGNYVADFRTSGNIQTIEFMSHYSSGDYGYDMAVALVELRNAIESAAVCKVAEMYKGRRIESLHGIIEELDSASEAGSDMDEISLHEKEFHYEIIRLSGNPMFMMMMNSFEETGMPLWKRCVEFWGARETIAFNRKILDLIESGRGPEAADIINEMLRDYSTANGI